MTPLLDADPWCRSLAAEFGLGRTAAEDFAVVASSVR